MTPADTGESPEAGNHTSVAHPPLAVGSSPVDPPPIVQLIAISKAYGHVQALSDIDFALEAGEVHALVGDNGAGKSTLVKIIAGAIQASSGELRIAGIRHALAGPEDALRAGIATVYQGLALVGCRSIEANLFLGREPTRFGFLLRRRMRAEAVEMVASMRQMNVSDTRVEVADLSGGQRQAVAIARGVRLGSRVLVLDEPTASLGVQESHQVLDIIDGLKDNQRSVLIVSHNLAHVFRVADRITVLRGGRRVETVRKADTTPDAIVRMITGADFL